MTPRPRVSSAIVPDRMARTAAGRYDDQPRNEAVAIDDREADHRYHQRDLGGEHRLIGRGPVGRPAPEDQHRVDHARQDHQRDRNVARGREAPQRHFGGAAPLGLVERRQDQRERHEGPEPGAAGEDMDGVVDAVREPEPALLHHGMTGQREARDQKPRRERGCGLTVRRPGGERRGHEERRGGLGLPGAADARLEQNRPERGRIERIGPAVADQGGLHRKRRGGRRHRERDQDDPGGLRAAARPPMRAPAARALRDRRRRPRRGASPTHRAGNGRPRARPRG